MYCNEESTSLPLVSFVWKLLDVTQYCCTLYLTARLLTIVREHFLGPI